MIVLGDEFRLQVPKEGDLRNYLSKIIGSTKHLRLKHFGIVFSILTQNLHSRRHMWTPHVESLHGLRGLLGLIVRDR